MILPCDSEPTFSSILTMSPLCNLPEIIETQNSTVLSFTLLVKTGESMNPISRTENQNRCRPTITQLLKSYHHHPVL